MDPESLRETINQLAKCLNGKLNHRHGLKDAFILSDLGEEFLSWVAETYAQLLAPLYARHAKKKASVHFAWLAIAIRLAFGSLAIETAGHLVLALLSEFNWQLRTEDKDDICALLGRLYDAIKAE